MGVIPRRKEEKRETFGVVGPSNGNEKVVAFAL
jgi:hypothetical protein